MKQKFWIPDLSKIFKPRERIDDIKDKMTEEPELFNTYLCVILRSDGLYYIYQPKSDNLKQFTYRGNTYEFDPENAFRLRGWVPWKKAKSAYPWSVLSDYFDAKNKIGLLLYREVPKEEKKVITPLTFDGSTSLRTPKLFKSIVNNPLLKNYRRRQKFERAAMGILFWGVVALAVILLIVVLTGVKF